ncbi:MAG TPA: hypothetical protein VHF89_17975, partial [Solirubrobacteraceae bacterium]|nr:hypothetical protein [Solirubrobacteraceae bacterium]
SLIYANDGNGCNGFDGGGAIHVPPLTVSPDMDREMVKGPFNPSRTYSACYFWMPWFTLHGWDTLRDLLTTHMPAAAGIANENEEGIVATTAASGETMFEQQQMFAVHALTAGRGMNTYGALLGGPQRDWAAYLESWQPKPLQPGTPHTRTLQPGGMMANAITEPMRVEMNGPKKDVKLFTVTDDGTNADVDRYGGQRLRPRAGEKLWVVAARPGVGPNVPVTLTAK